MKVAYFSESPADEAALKIFTEAVLGKQTESVIHAGLRHRPWPAIKLALRSVFLQLHYHTDAEGLVLIVDSNGSPPHLLAHNEPEASEPKCRLCQLKKIISEAQRDGGKRQHQPPLKIALGLAVPAIEAWLLCGVDAHVSEAAWINGQKENRLPYTTAVLKTKLYGSDRPSLPIETEAMTAAATRLVVDLSGLKNLFPVGFGNLHTDLSGW